MPVRVPLLYTFLLKYHRPSSCSNFAMITRQVFGAKHRRLPVYIASSPSSQSSQVYR